jgi:hypothetical protein
MITRDIKQGAYDALDIQLPNSPTTDSLADVTTTLGSKQYSRESNQKKLSGAGAQSKTPFTFTGTVIVWGLGGACLLATDSTTVSGCYFDVDDGTVQVALDDTATPTDCSGIAVGGYVATQFDNTSDMVFNNSDQVRVTPVDTAYGPATVLTAKAGATNKIRFNFTGDANTDVDIEFRCKYFGLTSDGKISKT